MNILIINGSPKDRSKSYSVNYAYYILKNFSNTNIDIIDVSKNIEKIEKDKIFLKSVIEKINNSDAIIWACPVYVALIPSQLKRFIELIFEKKIEYIFKNKYAASITSSIKFYDHFAHYYLHGICDDLNMKYAGYYSADMDDIMIKKERDRMKKFGKIFIDTIKNNQNTIKKYQEIKNNNFIYIPNINSKKIETNNKKIVILSDYDKNSNNLYEMVEKFKDHFDKNIEEINLEIAEIKTGCQGCHACAYDNTCFMKNQDDFDKIFKEKLMPADIIIFAFKIYDRFFSSRVKRFLDRSFFMNHVPYFLSKQAGLIISGPAGQIHYLTDALNQYASMLGFNAAESISDENENSNQIDENIETMAKKIIYQSNLNYFNSSTFLEIGGKKIFRDNMWGRFRLINQADHRYYLKNNF